MIPEQTIAAIRERVDIVALVGEYVRLNKSGASFKGLCPFHAEKTPSFYVHPQRRFFHCFGCQASGDVFSFLTRLEGIPFPEAATRLAEQAGVEIEAADPAQDAERKRRRRREERLVELVDVAAGFFIEQLARHPNAHLGRTMCDERGLTQETVAKFRLGYAPDEWDGLTNHLRQRGFALEDAEAVGLIVPRRGGSGYYDRFRHRLMFPIADHQGRIVAFSGRILPALRDDGREPGAKYINSPEGPLYTKGEVLFGLHEGRVAIRRTGQCVICEGNFDLVKLHQAGVENAVAPMGTALTAQQAALLKRFAERVVLLFDGDRAGHKAVRAAYPLLMKAGLQASVVGLPPGDDPDSFLAARGAEALVERIEGAPNIVEYLIDHGAAQTAGDPSAKAAAIEALGPVLRAVDNPVEVRLYVERVAQRFEVRDIEAVRRQLRRGLRAARGQRNGREGPPRRDAPPRPVRREPPDPLASEILGAFIDRSDLLLSPLAERFGEVLTDPDLRAILQATSRMVGQRGGVEAAALIAELGENAALAWLEGRLVQPVFDDDEAATTTIEQAMGRLEARSLQRQSTELARQAMAARANGDDALADDLTRKMSDLRRRVVDLQRTRGLR